MGLFIENKGHKGKKERLKEKIHGERDKDKVRGMMTANQIGVREESQGERFS